MVNTQAPVQQGKTDSLAIMSLIGGLLSIISLLLSFCIPCGLRFAALIFGAGGVLLGIISKKRIDESMGAKTGRKMAASGLVLGSIGGIITLILIVIFAIFFAGSSVLIPLFGSNF